MPVSLQVPQWQIMLRVHLCFTFPKVLQPQLYHMPYVDRKKIFDQGGDNCRPSEKGSRVMG